MQALPGVTLQHSIALLDVSTLLLAIPYILNTTPSLPFPDRMHTSTRRAITKHILFLAAIILSLVPDSTARIMSNLLLITTLTGTYLLPGKCSNIHPRHIPI